MLEQIDHVNLVVQDLDTMVDFYCRVLGMKVTRRVTISGPWIDAVVLLAEVKAQVVYLELGRGPRVELIRYDSPVTDRPNGLDHAHTPGLRHLAMRVTDIDTTVDKLRRAGVKPFGPVMQVPDEQVTYSDGMRKRLVYFADPEGNLLELCEYR